MQPQRVFHNNPRVRMDKAQVDVLDVSTQCSYACVEKVAGLVQKVATWIDMPNEDKQAVVKAVTEAVQNAICHGNREGESKMIRVRIQTAPSEITVFVRDDGKEFEVEAVPDLIDPQHRNSPHGRGMNALMDDVKFFSLGKGGSLVKMTKRFIPQEVIAQSKGCGRRRKEVELVCL